LTGPSDSRAASERLRTLEGAIDLRAIPFTEPGGRLLVFLDGDGTLRVSSAEYERPAEACGPVRALRFLGASGATLPLEASARPDRVSLRVAGRPATLAFADPDTLVLRLPVGRSHLLLQTRAEARSWRHDPDGAGGQGAAVFEGLRRPFRWRIGGRLLHREAVQDAEGRLEVRVEVEAEDGDALVLQDGTTEAGDTSDVLARAAARWDDRLARVPLPSAAPGSAGPDGTGPGEAALRAAWVLAANEVRLRSHPADVAVVPSKVGYVALWQWDAYFHAIGLRHLDPARARDQLRLALRCQLPDGMLPDVLHDEGVLASSSDMVAADRERSLLHIGRREASSPRSLLVAPVTKPPLTALAVWKVFEAERDRTFLAEVYPALVRSQRWWFEHSRPRGRALPIYLHPYSSGVDDSPLWDLGWPVATPDLPAYLCLQADCLAGIADELERPGEAAAWRSEAAAIAGRLLARHWRAGAGAFVSFRRGHIVPADTVIGLIPLITGRLPQGIAGAVVRTLTDPDRFWPAYPVPSVATSDPEFEPATMWRGPTWLFMDYLLVDGLRRAGHPEVAARLRERALRLVEQGQGTAEFYHPLDGTRPARATAMFSGAAALYLDLLLAPEG
jgi:putative isomerase